MNRHPKTRRRSGRLLAALALLLGAGAAPADEGMWTLHDFPHDAVAERYGARIDDAWLERVQKSTARLDGGCTGSFASADGLVLTNNHCVWGCIRNLSTDDDNLSDSGFLAGTRAQERQCPGARVSVLQETEEITDQVREATAGLDEVEANAARKALLSRLESECEAAGELSCESVDLYRGGQFYLYRYKRYDDVRLVFAPELAVGAFGGDPDNFNFPRWSLDMSFLRVYEDGQPAATPHFFPWRAGGARAGEAVFVSGHPGSTNRLLTVAELDLRRSNSLPMNLVLYSEYRGRMLEWGETGPEAARQVQQRILSLENGIKVWKNRLRSLMDSAPMQRKVEAEAALREAVEADPQLAAAYGSAWTDAERAVANYRAMYDRYQFLEGGRGFQGSLARYARALVRGAAEREKPNEERLRAWRDTALPRVEQRLLAATPIDPGYEELGLAFSLDKLREWLGPDDEAVRALLGNESPRALAGRLVAGTRLADADYRRQLWTGGVDAVAASDDPMIDFARRLEPFALALRRQYDDQVEAPLNRASESIARARFAIGGKSVYPDATFTLRVSYGAVEGWTERGVAVEPFTRMGRAFERATGQPPFRLPDSWLEARERIDADTPYNFVSTNDIIGGNCGSPIVNARAELVGLVFDGNIHSIAGDFWFDPRVNRAVSVHVAAMLEALETIYGATALRDELTVVD